MIKLTEIQKLLLASIFIAMIENKIKQMSNKKNREKIINVNLNKQSTVFEFVNCIYFINFASRIHI